MPAANPVTRRSVKYATLEDLLRDIDQIESAERAGRLQAQGTWTPGQVLGHVAAWIEYGYDGYPMQPPPWIIRVILRWQVKKYLRNGMPSGVRIPKVAAGTFGVDVMPLAEGAARLRKAVARLQAGEPARYDSPAFGPMNHEERIQLNLRHAELHLSFLRWE